MYFFFFFNDTATTEIYTLSLHDALPISPSSPDTVSLPPSPSTLSRRSGIPPGPPDTVSFPPSPRTRSMPPADRKSTRLNSSHANISYAVFCLKKKKNTHNNSHFHLHISV